MQNLSLIQKYLWDLIANYENDPLQNLFKKTLTSCQLVDKLVHQLVEFYEKTGNLFQLVDN